MPAWVWRLHTHIHSQSTQGVLSMGRVVHGFEQVQMLSLAHQLNTGLLLMLPPFEAISVCCPASTCADLQLC